MRGGKTTCFGMVLALAALAFWFTGLGTGYAQVVQTPLPGNKIPQFVDPLPDLATLVPGGTMETVIFNTNFDIYMHEFKAKVLPKGTFAAGVAPDTWVWGYRLGATAPTTAVDTFIGPIVLASRGIPTQIKYVNKLGNTAGSNVLAYTQSTDQSLHWANPGNAPMMVMQNGVMVGNPAHYSGPIPAVPHLHGGEVPPVIDGGPDAWFVSDATLPAGYDAQGPAYYTRPGVAANANEAVYRYPNTQEEANIWFHDHTLGATRLNVYAGIAGAYPLIDPDTIDFYTKELPYPLVPLVIQDRMFDTTGQLLFPALGDNPALHPYWLPEFVGDTIAVNGKVWPKYNVASKRYRFLFLNGSNARAYELFLINKATGVKGPVMWQIGTDGGYLNSAVKIDPNVKPLDKLVIMPGERADVIIDFTGQAPGTVLRLVNTAKTPYPNGAPVDGRTTARIMEFVVGAAGSDPNHLPGTFNPTVNPAIRTGAANGRPEPIMRLPGAPGGPVLGLPGLAGANVQKWRQLTLNEVMGPAGPFEALVNNSKWSGLRSDGTNIPGAFEDNAGNWITEFPNEGDTEIWDIINLTADAHPIHLHLVQFQLISRQAFDVKGYSATYNGKFPGGTYYDPMMNMDVTFAAGVYIPAFGPPMNYNTVQTSAVNGGQFIGGNPDVTPFLSKKAAAPPNANEAGWKDTVIMFPGQVTRIAVRYAPTDKALDSATLYYPFDPNALGADYVWHCHIIDHEDNEMMRPYQVNPTGPAPADRDYVQGLGNDY